MSTKFEFLAVRLFGLYLLTTTISDFFFTTPYVFNGNSDTATMIMHGVHYVLYLLFVAICLFRTQWVCRMLFGVSEEESVDGRGPFAIAFWINLIGLYYLIWSVGYMVTYIVMKISGDYFDSDRLLDTGIVQQGVLFTLSLVCILYAESIGAFMQSDITDEKATDSDNLGT